MQVNGRPMRSISVADDGWGVEVVDQTRLPHELCVARLETLADAVRAISEMVVRGAPLIGATAAYGMALALRADPADPAGPHTALLATRPTAVNLRWALDRVRSAVESLPEGERVAAAYAEAAAICDEDVAICSAIGDHGLPLIQAAWEAKGGDRHVNVLTHCNAGWLATVDWGTATAPIYKAHDAGLPIHVWVSETRPRSQGASLTAWELLNHGVRHTVIVDGAGAHLMRTGHVDLVVTGTDRTTATGDVANKIGTYPKALAARDNDVPFYVALPSPTIDWTLRDGADIPIEDRSGLEVSQVRGLGPDGAVVPVDVIPRGSAVANPAFDVTPARLITGLITERGVAPASEEGLRSLFPA